jgi:hypothetical protein
MLQAEHDLNRDRFSSSLTAIVKSKNLSKKEKLQIACFKKSQVPKGDIRFPIQ